MLFIHIYIAVSFSLKLPKTMPYATYRFRMICKIWHSFMFVGIYIPTSYEPKKRQQPAVWAILCIQETKKKTI